MYLQLLLADGMCTYVHIPYAYVIYIVTLHYILYIHIH